MDAKILSYGYHLLTGYGQVSYPVYRGIKLILFTQSKDRTMDCGYKTDIH